MSDNAKSLQPDRKEGAWVDDKGRLRHGNKPVQGEFTREELEAAYGDLETLSQEIKRTGGFVML